MTRNDFLMNVMWYNGSRFLNLAEGKCDFNNEDFISLLEYSASLPEEIDWSKYDEDYYANYDTMFSSGRIVLKSGYLYNARNFYVNNYNTYYGDYTTVGFPSSSGNGIRLSKGFSSGPGSGRSASASTRLSTPTVTFFPHTGHRPPSLAVSSGSRQH